MTKVNEYYRNTTGISKEVCDVLLKEVENVRLTTATTQFKGLSDKRICKTGWIYGDSWIGGMLAHYVNVANNQYFQYDLVDWASQIQYTVYDTEGSLYSWHYDTCETNGLVRKLSISMCLSDPSEYEGGEFQIRIRDGIETFKMGRGEVIVFPSDCYHKVRKIRSGTRRSLVGWMGGPRFR